MSLKNEAQFTAAPSDSRAQAFQGCSALVPQGPALRGDRARVPRPPRWPSPYLTRYLTRGIFPGQANKNNFKSSVSQCNMAPAPQIFLLESQRFLPLCLALALGHNSGS